MSELAEVPKEKELVPFMGAIANAKASFNEVNSAHNLLDYKKEAMFAMQAIKNNDYLMSVANNNPNSLRDAVVNIAAIGLSLNPAEKLAYLVPRRTGQKDKNNNKLMGACLDISYIGMIRLATDTGSIMWAKAELVHENDVFVWHGATEKPEFTSPNPFDPGPVIGVYCVAKTKEGDYLSGKMSIKEVYDIRDRSESFKAYAKENWKLTPWVTDEGEMIKKTIIKREAKTWPKSDKTGRLENAIQYLNEHNEEGIDFSNQIGTDPVDYQRVEEAYIKAIEIIDSDDMDWGSDKARELFYQLTQDEQMALHNKLRNYKPGKRQYNTIWKEYLSYMPEPELPEHIKE